MHIDILTKNITLDPPIETFVEEKIGSLERLAHGSAVEARVEIGKPSQHHAKGNVYYAEVNLQLGGALLRATATRDDLRTAIVDVKEELHRQLTKFKEKPADLARQRRT